MSVQLSEQTSRGVKCLLCPHYCLLEEGQVGKCRARHNKDGESQYLYPGVISSLAVEPIEKKPFKHFLPRSKTLSAGGIFCNLDCKFCENFSISQSPSVKNASVKNDVFKGWENLVSVAKEKGCESISLSYNEPTLSYERLMDLGEKCQQEDLKFLLKTNAFVNRMPWKEICQVVDAINIDWKGSKEKFRFITGINSYAYVLQHRIREAYDYGVHLEISIPLYYQSEEIEEEMEIVGRFLSSLDREIPCHLLRISPSYKYENFIFDSKNMDKAKSVLSNYMDNIYVVN